MPRQPIRSRSSAAASTTITAGLAELTSAADCGVVYCSAP
jgi:hypothetical protein